MIVLFTLEIINQIINTMNNNRSLNENNPFNSKDENDLDEIDFSSDFQDKLNESITYVFNSNNTELKFKFDLPIGKKNITIKKNIFLKLDFKG